MAMSKITKRIRKLEEALNSPDDQPWKTVWGFPGGVIVIDGHKAMPGELEELSQHNNILLICWTGKNRERDMPKR
jgi:hypothetical protein